MCVFRELYEPLVDLHVVAVDINVVPLFVIVMAWLITRVISTPARDWRHREGKKDRERDRESAFPPALFCPHYCTAITINI